MSNGPMHAKESTITGSDEIVLRDPLYVFAVVDELTDTMTDEVRILKQGFLLVAVAARE
jgi:hypothetical protein